MKITQHILNLPPYISTAWQNILALQMKPGSSGPLLIVDLVHGDRVEIPDLTPSVIEQVFATHAAFLEQASQPKTKIGKSDPTSLTLSLPMKLLGEGFEEQMNAILQHNPNAADSPDMPQEVLSKIATIAQSLGIEDPAAIPSPEEKCNCVFCQVARTMRQAIASGHETPVAEIEEEVSEEDLLFKTWDIHQKDRYLYEVSNPLDKNEQYQVYLGSPIGCTCGQDDCEHVHAVLKS